jgi:hypothetical protein
MGMMGRRPAGWRLIMLCIDLAMLSAVAAFITTVSMCCSLSRCCNPKIEKTAGILYTICASLVAVMIVVLEADRDFPRFKFPLFEAALLRLSLLLFVACFLSAATSFLLLKNDMNTDKHSASRARTPTALSENALVQGEVAAIKFKCFKCCCFSVLVLVMLLLYSAAVLVLATAGCSFSSGNRDVCVLPYVWGGGIVGILAIIWIIKLKCQSNVAGDSNITEDPRGSSAQNPLGSESGTEMTRLPQSNVAVEHAST